MRRCDAHLVDEQLRRLVRMDVVNGGRHADDDAHIDRDDEMVPRIGKELGGPARVYGVIEHSHGDTLEHGRIVSAKQPNVTLLFVHSTPVHGSWLVIDEKD